MTDAQTRPYLVDVIVPVYGIGPVMVDTVLSVFDQQDSSFRLRCVVVVDGCPMIATTSGLLTDLAASGAYDLEVIYQKNGGVISARNTAIDHIMSKTERSDFVLFLDGDDLLGPGYVKASIQAILDTPAPPGKEIGWAYADQFHFGDKTHWVQYPTRMWGARFAQNNFSQPSSLILTKLLEDGLRFDPQFNLGIEDWDFWCGAVRHGYVGAYVEDSYVFYRRLIGSRSSFNRSNDGLTRFRMALKHGLDSHAFVTDGAEIFPRFGLLATSAADLALADQLDIPADVRFGLTEIPDTSQTPDPEQLLARFFGRLAPQLRYRTGGILDAPYTPQLILLGASGDTAALERSHLFAAEHLFVYHPQLAALECRLPSGGQVLIAAPTRLYNRNGRLKPQIDCAALDIRHGAEPALNLEHEADTETVGQVLSAASADLVAVLRARAPKSMSRAQRGFARNVVGTQLSHISDFYRTSLGYLPLWLLPGETPDQARAAFVLPADGQGVSWDQLEDMVTERETAGDTPYCVLLQSRNTDPARAAAFRERLGTVFFASRTLTLFDIFAPNPYVDNQFYNGTPLDNDRKDWVAYATGALSHFSTIVNFGQTPITMALASLKTSRRTQNIYVPNPRNRRVDEIEHLCAFLTTYALIQEEDDTWRSEAAGLGVREASLAVSESEKAAQER